MPVYFGVGMPASDIKSISGVELTGRNWSSDFMNLTSLYFRFYYPADSETFTTTPLAAGATYVGPTRDFAFSRLGFFNAMAYSDQASATNGFYVEQSIDGTNWDLRTAESTVSAGVGAGIKAAVVGRYARVVYTNGAAAQTVFRLGGRYVVA